MSDLASRFADYARHRMPELDAPRVEELERIFGGASRETWRLRLRGRVRDIEWDRRLILRRDPAGSLIETDRRTEFLAYRAFHGSSVPVPEALWLEQDPRWLEQPFFVMEELAGFESRPQMLMAPPYAAHLEKLGEQKWSILGEIAKADPRALGLHEVMPEPAADAVWRRELAHWEKVLDEDELCPQPIVRAAIRWLRRNPPPPAQKVTVVHADYRTGNFLFDADGNVRAILDWEMAHLGDPLEDLAWSLARIWCWTRNELRGGLLPKQRAIEIWERASGLRADPAGLLWWELFSCVKGQGIWVSSAREYEAGKNQDAVLALAAWMQTNAQDRSVLELMGKLS